MAAMLPFSATSAVRVTSWPTSWGSGTAEASVTWGGVVSCTVNWPPRESRFPEVSVAQMVYV